MGLRAISFVSFLVMVRELTMYDYGNLQLLFSLIGPAVTITSLGLNQLITSDIAVYRGAADVTRMRRLIADYVWVVSILTAVLILAAWLFQDGIKGLVSADLQTYFFLLCLLIISQIIQNTSSVILTAFERFGELSLYQFAEGVVRLLVLLSLYVVSEFSLYTVSIAYIIGKFVPSLVSVFSIRKILRKFELSKDKPFMLIANVMKKHGKWDMVSVVLSTSVGNLWPWIVRTFAGTGAVAVYAFSQKIYSTVVGVLPLRSVLFPVISTEIHKGRKYVENIVTKAKKYLFFAYLAAIILLAIVLAPALNWFFPEYVSAYWVIMIMMTHLFIDVYSLGQTAVLYAHKKQKDLFAVSVFSVVMAVVSQISLIYLFGIWGMVAAWLLTSLVIAFLRELVVQKKTGLRLWNWRSFFIYDEFDKKIVHQFKKRLFKHS